MFGHMEDWISGVKMNRKSYGGLFLSIFVLLIAVCPIKAKIVGIAERRITEWIQVYGRSYAISLMLGLVLAISIFDTVVSVLAFVVMNHFIDQDSAALTAVGVFLLVGTLIMVLFNKKAKASE